MKLKVLGHEVSLEKSLVDEDAGEIRRQLEEYLSGDREQFSLVIDRPDSFTGRVMMGISSLGYGDTASYGDIAEKLDTSAVAVGQACASNPLPIIIPCHRVTGKDSIGGYQYPGLKEKLLELEAERADTGRNPL